VDTRATGCKTQQLRVNFVCKHNREFIKELRNIIQNLASINSFNTSIIHSATDKKTPWPESVRELYRPSYRRLSAKLLSTFQDRGCHVVSVMDPYGRILGFLDQSSCLFYQVAPQLHSRGWVDPVPDPLLLWKCGRNGNRTWASGSVAMNSGH
jgi:hypothetical protein